MQVMKFFSAVLFLFSLIGCSGPDFYGNHRLEVISDYYARGGKFKSRSAWKNFEMIGGYHLYLSVSGGAHSSDYNFNLIAEPEVKTQAVVKRLEIIHDGGVEIIFKGSKKIGGAIFLGARKSGELRNLCDQKGVLNVRVITSEKVIEYKMQRKKTSVLDAT